MSAKRFVLPLALLIAVASIPAEGLSQRLFVSGGAHLASSTVQSDLRGTSPAFQGGVQFQESEYIRARLAATSQASVLSVDGALQVHVLGDGVDVGNDKLNPYLMAGYGYYLSGGGGNNANELKGLFPAGVGVEYGLMGNLGAHLEVGGRFGVNEVENGNRLNVNVISGVMPSIGITYQLERIERRPVNAPRISSAEGADEPQRREGDYVARGEYEAPFADPAGEGGGGGPAQKFDLPYTIDSLRNTDPLIVRRGEEPPFPDPGRASLSGEVTLSEDGTMVRLPDGTFIMGLTDQDELNRQSAGRKQVTVSSFYMDRFEVTNAEYREFVNSLSGQEAQERLPDSNAWSQESRQMDWESYFRGSRNSDRPVVAVTWSDARAFCEWEGKRLPTEAEWEYAARAGRVGGVYPWSGLSTQDAQGRYLANFNPQGGQSDDGHSFTAPVGSYPPNRWGLHDMAGNVAEWVLDAYTPTYRPLSGTSPVYRDPEAEAHVVRGGSWDARAFEIGVGYRQSQPDDEASTRIGFRCAADISSIEGSMEEVGEQSSAQTGNESQTTEQQGGGQQDGGGQQGGQGDGNSESDNEGNGTEGGGG